jgi:quinol monooxygenase YgiN
MKVVRISLARFDSHIYEVVRDLLEKSQQVLVPEIRALRGNLAYYVGIDPINNAMTNVSIWESLEDANQMAAMNAMADLATQFAQIGVIFDRPITNHDVIWQS